MNFYFYHAKFQLYSQPLFFATHTKFCLSRSQCFLIYIPSINPSKRLVGRCLFFSLSLSLVHSLVCHHAIYMVIVVMVEKQVEWVMIRTGVREIGPTNTDLSREQSQKHIFLFLFLFFFVPQSRIEIINITKYSLGGCWFWYSYWHTISLSIDIRDNITTI